MTVDLEERIRQTLREWAEEITEVEDRWPAPLERPGPERFDADLGGDHRSPVRQRAAILLAAAAVFLVVIGTVAVLRSADTTTETVAGGPDDAPVPEADGRPPAPRYVASVLPVGYEPILAVDDASSSEPADRLAETIQRFSVGAGSLTLVVHPLTADGAPSDDGPLSWALGPGGRLDASDPGGLALVSAMPDGLDAAAAIDALDRLVRRGDDPMAGFDVAGAASDGSPMAMTAEQVWPRGSTKPAFSTVYYAAAGATAPTLAISATAPAGAPDLQLVRADGGSRREVVAGAERVVADQPPPSGGVNGGLAGRSVAWYDVDGTFLTVQALGVSDAEVAQVVAGIQRADETASRALDDRIRATIAALPVSRTISWGEVELSFRGDPRPDPAVPGSWAPDGACVRTGGDPERCGAFVGAREGLYGPVLTFAAGRSDATTWMIESGRSTASIPATDGWWVVGAFDMAGDVDVRRGDDRADGLYSQRFEDQGIAFAARLSSGDLGATVTASESTGPNGTAPTGAAPFIEIAVARPR